MIGPLLGALTSGAGIAVNAANQSTANGINWRAVMETIRSNREQEQLQKATREDAYGNKITYRDGAGFGYDLTPITEAILGNEQGERLRSLREDAPRNRAAAVRMDDRSKLADEEFQDVFNEYKYRDKPREGEFIGDAQTLLQAARNRGEAESANLVAQQLLRQGNSSNVGKVYQKAADNSARTLAETLINAKRIGREDYRSAENFDMQKYGGELGFLGGIADKTTNSPIMPNNFNEQLSGRADQALASLTQVLSQGNQQLSSALQTAAQGFGQPMDFSGIANALSKLSFGGGEDKGDGYNDGGTTTHNPGIYDPWAGLRTTTI